MAVTDLHYQPDISKSEEEAFELLKPLLARVRGGSRLSDALVDEMPEVSVSERTALLSSMDDLFTHSLGKLRPFLPPSDSGITVESLHRDIKLCLYQACRYLGTSFCEEGIEAPGEETFEAAASAALSCARKICGIVTFEGDDYTEISGEEVLRQRSTKNVSEVTLDGSSIGEMKREIGLFLRKISLLEERKGLLDYSATSALYNSLVAEGIERYGAKGARLRALGLVFKSIEGASLPYGLRNLPEIPEFRLVETQNYRDYLDGRPLSDMSEDDYKWVRSRRQVIVRSSAAFSEDSHSLGAGIYKSVLLPPNPSREELHAAEEYVYQSMNSDQAKRHRENIGLSEDFMGLVLHEFNAGCDSFYVYSHRRNHVPSMRDLVFQKISFHREPEVQESTPVIMTEKSARSGLFFHDIDCPRCLAMPLDYTRDIYPVHIEAAAVVSVFVDLVTGTPHQTETVLYDRSSCGLVQLRPLPSPWLEPVRVVFPSPEDCLLNGRCVGVFNGTLQVLGDSADNCRKKGFVVMNPAQMGSAHINWIETRIPAEGAIYLVTNSTAMRGHVESRCLERGICIIMDEDPAGCATTIFKVLRYMNSERSPGPSKSPYIIDPEIPGLEVEVISDGIRAAILPGKKPGSNY